MCVSAMVTANRRPIAHSTPWRATVPPALCLHGPVKDIVLLHGTTSGQNGYERLAVALRLGWSVHGTDLPTDRPECAVDEYVALLTERVGEDVDSPVVLGHSGGGLLVEAVGAALGARHLVWLAAYIPQAGKSLRDDDLNSVFNDEWVGVDPTSDDAAATYFLYHDCDYATLRWALTTGRLWFPVAVSSQPWRVDHMRRR